MTHKTVRTRALEIAYLEHGPSDGWPCILGHGFPYDAHAYDATAAILAADGARVLVPWLRGYGPTRFLAPDTPRSGEQAALGADMRDFMDALGIERALLGGYDWGGRACCVVAALWPERVAGLVSGNAYNIQNIARSWEPVPPAEEASYWYQFYFHSERGRRGLAQDRRAIARQIWGMWSPTWAFDEATFQLSATAWDNPDFVDVVIHSYRHRFGLVPGDPAVAHIETMLTAQPRITVPTIAVDGAVDGVDPGSSDHAPMFAGPYELRTWDDTGHNLPQEQPVLWAEAVRDVRALAA